MFLFLARFGSRLELSPICGIADQESRLIYQHEIKPEQKIKENSTASLVSMMKQTILSGSAKLISSLGFALAAGKTGTTSDYKDAWFAGFIPQKTAVVWVGYDTPISNGLTGANGVIPIWSEFMKKATANSSTMDFTWPPNTEVRSVPISELDGEKQNSRFKQ